MSVRSVLGLGTRISVVLACISSAYLYLYPLWSGCVFPSTTGSVRDGFQNTLSHRFNTELDNPASSSIAPFRFLVLADPQLEGDSSLPDPEDALLARLQAHWSRLRETNRTTLAQDLLDVTQQLLSLDIPNALWTARKSLDLFGNDYYLAHIYRTLHWWTIPTHVTVLGDLIGSQWVSDDEFDWRGWRYWNRVVAGARRVDDETMQNNLLNNNSDWTTQIINIAGNHDIGYAGDITQDRIARFERVFGKANWDIKFPYPHPTPNNTTVPSLHMIVLNDMVLDGPHMDSSLQGDTYSYLNGLITEPRLEPVTSKNTFTLLLTHVPLHKEAGICIDPPFFSYWPNAEDDENGPGGNGAYAPEGLREQNHLSQDASTQVLESLFGMSGNEDAPAQGRGRPGLILTGHDHEGCDVVHYIRHGENSAPETKSVSEDADADAASSDDPESDVKTWSWQANHTTKFTGRLPNTAAQDPKLDGQTSLREITLRSMMGSYGGNAGLLSLWFDFDAHEWRYEMSMCPLGVQHIWWAVHVIDIIAVLFLVVQLVRSFGGGKAAPAATKVKSPARVKVDKKRRSHKK